MMPMWKTFVVVACLAAPAEPSPKPVDTVQTVELHGNEIYAVNIRRGLTTMRFPFRCTASWVSKAHLVEAGLSSRGFGVLNVATFPDAPIGTSVDATVLCEPTLAISLHMTITEDAQTSPRIDFVWSDDELTLYQQRHQHEIAELQAAHDRELDEVRESKELDIQYILANARQAFERSARKDSGRSGSVAVHVDGEKRLGELGIIEFRIANRERTAVRVSRIEVSGVGSSAATVSFATGDDAAADLQSLVGGTSLSDPLILPGKTVEASVAFPWPGDTTQFKLAVHLGAPEPREVEVRNIEF